MRLMPAFIVGALKFKSSSNGVVSESQVGSYLLVVNRCEYFYRFHFNQYALFDHQVGTIRTLDSHVSIDEWDCFLNFDP